MHYPIRFPACLVLILCLVTLSLPAYALTVSVRYPASDEALVNPYIGNAVWANSDPDHEQPFTLVYANLVWADFEPEQGQYDFATFETENQFDLWRAQGKHLILRFILDIPSAKNHRDIPDWLYQATGKDGVAYNVPYGRGYSPNYENPILMDAHAKAIAALGERYGNDPFVAYVEIGSLGHWGEWHVYEEIGVMPPKAIRDQYVMPYVAAFPNAFLLMRRPFAIAKANGIGLFNDTSGEPVSTETWLGWISDGGDYNAPDGVGALVPMQDAWRTSPIGGELATSVKRETLLDTLLSQTMDLFTQSHTSWIGPGSFSDIQQGGDLQVALNEINRTIGYRLRIAQCDVSEVANGDVRITLQWENDGIAPFYFDWQPTLSITGEDGAVTFLPLDMHLIDVQPDAPFSVSMQLPRALLAKGTHTISLGILNPATHQAGVALGMTVDCANFWYELLRLDAQ